MVVLKDICPLWSFSLQEKSSKQYMKYSFVHELSFVYVPLHFAVAVALSILLCILSLCVLSNTITMF